MKYQRLCKRERRASKIIGRGEKHIVRLSVHEVKCARERERETELAYLRERERERDFICALAYFCM